MMIDVNVAITLLEKRPENLRSVANQRTAFVIER